GVTEGGVASGGARSLGIDLGRHYGRIGWRGPGGELVTAGPVRLSSPGGRTTDPSGLAGDLRRLSELASEAGADAGGGRGRVAVSLEASGKGELPLRRAAEAAGLSVAHAVPEPVAAALHYGAVAEGAERTVLVCDQGAGALDLTVLAVSGDRTVRVLDTVSHPVGGNAWDAAVARAVLPGADETAAEQLAVARELREALGDRESAAVEHDGPGAGAILHRTDFEEVTAPLRRQAEQAVAAVLGSAAERPGGTVSAVLAAGGLFATPGLARELEERIGLYVRCGEPELAVVDGLVLLESFGVLRVLTGRQAATVPPRRPTASRRPDPEPRPARRPDPEPPTAAERNGTGAVPRQRPEPDAESPASPRASEPVPPPRPEPV
ncbi:Hsp70 family protein, partial [Streptomyces sp. A7024]